MFGLVNNIRSHGWSATLIAVATAVLAAWLNAHVLLAAVHDDGTTIKNALTVVNSSDARTQLVGLIDQAGSLAGGLPELTAVGKAIVSAPKLDPKVSDAITSALVSARDSALVQLSGDGPAKDITIPMKPVLQALGIPVTQKSLKQLGISSSSGFDVPVVPAAQVPQLRLRYLWTTLLDQWGLILAAVLGVIGVVLSPRRWRTLTVMFALGAVVCLTAPLVFHAVGDWIAGGGIGAWSALVGPLLTGAVSQLEPWLLPVGIAAGAVAAGLLVWDVVRLVRTRTPSAHREPALAPTPDEAV